MKRVSLLLLLALVSAACVEENADPAGLRVAQSSGGARVVFDLDAKPLPDVPFPNNVATRLDATSPTGIRVNISEHAATDLESRVRQKANQLDGFSVYGSIWVKFTEPLDVHNIVDRHRSPVPDFADDAVYLVDVDPRSPDFGKLHMLDLGSGSFPLTMKDPRKYFNFDARVTGASLAYESVREVDLNGNGVLDPLEDTDDDGVWDQPNTLNPGADPFAPGEFLDFYERESNTLIIRTMEVLRPGTTYAVVLTSALIDENGVPVDSPFDQINHTRQTKELEPLRKLLPKALPQRFDPSLSNVRFAWSFTTQTTTYELEQLRAGMYGSGKFQWLNREFPAELKMIHKMRSPNIDEQPTYAEVDRLLPILMQVLAEGLPQEGIASLTASAQDIDYIVSGSYVTPYFLADKDGYAGPIEETALNLNTHDSDEKFDVDYNTGNAAVGEDEVTWWCMVPKSKPGREAPFPVVFYGHGYGSSRIEGVGFAGQMAKFGLATCAIDNVAHGLPVAQVLDDVPLDVTSLMNNIGLGNMIDVLSHGRHRDLTNDGLEDPGGDYWVADVFHTRDNVRQTTIDYMQFIRIMRSWDGTKRWPDAVAEDDPYIKPRRAIVAGWDANGDGVSELAGDFNGDGIVDFGGEQPYYAWGQSLGGIQSAVLAAIDPTVRAAAPTAGGAGLGDIGIRSTQSGVPEAVVLPIIGPIVLGRPLETYDATTDSYQWSGASRLEMLVSNQYDEEYLPFATVDGLETGDRIVWRNLKREERASLVHPGTESEWMTVRDGVFRKGLAGDAVDGLVRQHALGFDPFNDVRSMTVRKGPVEAGLNERWFLRRGWQQQVSEGKTTAIDYTWGEGEAPAGLRPSEHSVEWSGVIAAPTDAIYTLKLTADGRARMYVNGRRVMDFRDGEATTRISFKSDQTYEVLVQFERTRATGAIQLSWETSGVASTVVPASAFTTHVPLSPEEAADYDKHVITDARAWGDPMVIEVYSADGELKQVIDTFEHDVYFQNIRYPAGTPLAFLREGFGLERQTPEFRRFLAIAQMILDKADPGSYAPHYFQRPLAFPYETPQFRDGMSNVLVVPTSGDPAVPVNTGISLARVAGIVDFEHLDSRYGKTVNQFIADNWVYEGISHLNRHPGYPDALFDIDDLDNGHFTSDRYPERGTDANPDADPPVRATVHTERGVSGMRIPYTRVDGEHGFYLADPTLGFDIHTFMVNQIGYYFATGGEVLTDDPCLEKNFLDGCSFWGENWQRPNVQ